MTNDIREILKRIEKTMCSTFSLNCDLDPEESVQGRITLDEFNALKAALTHRDQQAGVKHGSEAFIIRYNENTVPDDVFVGYGAREAAYEKYKMIGDSWNASLFQRVKINWHETSLHPAPTLDD